MVTEPLKWYDENAENPPRVGFHKMEDEHRGIKYSVVRGKGGGERRVSRGDPEVLRTGEASTAYHADLKVRQVMTGLSHVL
jgi:hypothetical protein